MQYIMYLRIALAAIKLLKKLANEKATKDEQKAAVKEVISLTAKSGSKNTDEVLRAFDDKDLETVITVVKFILGLKK